MVSRKAVINAGVVENVILADDDFELPDSLLITLPEGSTAAPGWTYDGEDFAPPVLAYDMDALKAAAVKTAMDFGNAITGQVTGAYAQAEILSWTTQEQEARAILDGNPPIGGLLEGLAADKGQDIETYAAGVVAKANAFRVIAQAAVRLRRRVSEVLLDPAVDSPEKLTAAVAALRAECEAIAAQIIPQAQ